MSDRSLLASNGRVAWSALEGHVEAERFTDGEMRQAREAAWVRGEPGGAITRQLLYGDLFRMLEDREGWAFGISDKDGYVGYVRTGALAAPVVTTHRVAVRTTWAWDAPDFKREPVFPLHMNSRICVTGVEAAWCEIDHFGRAAFVPVTHVREVAMRDDPVTVAHLMVGTPYVWGGNTGFGIDCSGLVQVAFHAAGQRCPADSSQQAGMAGVHLEPGAALMRGDLLFWKGHVALVSDSETLVHANAHHMAAAVEPLEDAIVRIAASDTGAVTLRLRPDAG
jgi:NlpC/P60 family/Bacterial dipeptidyl-peptidase Sh3 domain